MLFHKRYAGPERRITRPSPIFLIASIMGVAAIAYATLCPIGMRPHLGGANYERFGAYFVLGSLLAMSFRRQWAIVAVSVALLAFGLEACQLLVPGRDGRVIDAAVKALGGVSGAFAGYASFPLRRAFERAAKGAMQLVRSPR